MAGNLIILTGANGFIGKNFKSKLENVIELDQHNCWEFLNTFDKWDEVSLILHQGAISSTTETDISKIHKWNVEYTLQLFEYAIKYQIPVKYASSASVYGTMDGTIVNPLNYYAISKLQIDYWVQDNIDKFKSIQGFRYFNVYGNGEDGKGDQASPISKFSKQVKQTGKLQLFEGSDSMFRDFICVDEVVDIVINNKKNSGIYDLGTSDPVTFEYVANCIIQKYGGEIEIIPFPKHLVGKYQNFTCAQKIWDNYKFKTINQFLS
jgi:ADP-L-glycero-D-manno-heptose 6-epimerase